MKLPPDLERKCLELAGEKPAPARRTRKPAAEVARPRASLVLTVTIPVEVVPAANRREHWAAKARRVKAEADAAKAAVFTSRLSVVGPQAFIHEHARDPAFRVRVTLTRLGGRRWDDDNNVSGLKAVRDAVSKWWLLSDDGADWIEWRYAQLPGGPVGVEVCVEGGG